MTTPHFLETGQLDVLKVLYPWYKEEVFRRREHMMRLTAFACAFLVLLLVTILAIPTPSTASSVRIVFALAGISLFSGMFAYLILQERTRHTMAKQTLIEIERSLGLYEEGLYLERTTLYPLNWQSDWTRDHSVQIYLTVIAILTMLVIAAILIQF